MPNLDGTEQIKPVRFDAHDRRVRDVKPAEHQEYPKHLGERIVNNAEEEAAYKAAKAAQKKGR